ncbi:MAG: hypothetical protein WD646_05415 [Actinomycetota bacterium]
MRLDALCGGVSEGDIPDGAEVIVLLPGDESGFTLTDAERSELTEAIEQLRRGESIDGWELLRQLKS